MRAIALTVLACGVALAQAPEVPADAYALVAGEPILRAEVDAAAAEAGYPAAVLLENLIEARILERGLRTAGHDPAAIAADRVAELRAELAKEFGEAEAARFEDTGIRLRIALEAYAETRLDDDRLRAFYEEDRLRASGELRARHIQLPPTAQGLAAAHEVLAALGATPTDADVDRLARARSVDPFAPVNGGDLDWFGSDGRNLLGMIVPRSLVSACFELGKPGLVPYPVPSPGGYHLLYVVAVREGEDEGFEAAKPRLRRLLRRRVLRDAQAAWRDETEIVYAQDAPRLRPR